MTDREDDNEHIADTGPEKKRKTVTVNCSVPNGVQIRLHSPAVHDHAPQLPTGEGINLQQGQNTGIDKEWFEEWLAQNKSLSIVTTGAITWTDEKDEEEDRPDIDDEDRREPA